MEEIKQEKVAENGHTTVIINQVAAKGNTMGTAGFVMALLGVVFFWAPVLDWILWILGLVFSIIGVLRAPRGLAIAGLALSVVGVILISAFMSIFS